LLYFFFFLSIDLTPGLIEISGVPPQAAGLIEKKLTFAAEITESAEKSN